MVSFQGIIAFYISKVKRIIFIMYNMIWGIRIIRNLYLENLSLIQSSIFHPDKIIIL